jgi:hypothetical protein
VQQPANEASFFVPALGIAGLHLPSSDRAIYALRFVVRFLVRYWVGCGRQGYDLQLTRYDARDVLHDRDGALADERDRHRMGAHAVACGAAGGVGESQPGSSVGVRTGEHNRRLGLYLGSNH